MGKITEIKNSLKNFSENSPAILAWMIGSSLLLGVHYFTPEPKRPVYTEVKGTVCSEKYIPAIGGLFNSVGSGYIFTLNTENGRKVVQVNTRNGVYKEGIDALIEPGRTFVEIKVPERELDQRFYSVDADNIRILGRKINSH